MNGRAAPPPPPPPPLPVGLSAVAAVHPIGDRMEQFEPDPAVSAAMREDGIRVATVAEIGQMAEDARVEYLRTVHSWQLRFGVDDGLYQLWRKYESLCHVVLDGITGELCLRPRWSTSHRCLDHCDVDDIDPKGAEERRRATHRARLAAAADRALSYVEDVLLDVAGEKYPPSLRAKVAMDVLDRTASTSKRSESKVEVSGEIVHTHDVGERIREQLDRYAAAAVDDSIAAIEATFDAEVVEDAEIVEDAEEEDRDGTG